MTRGDLKPIAEKLLTQAKAILASPGRELELTGSPCVSEFGSDEWAEQFWLHLQMLHFAAGDLNRRPPEAEVLSQQIDKVQWFCDRL